MMKDERKTKAQLVEELRELRQRLADLEGLEAERKRAEEALRESEEQKVLILGSLSELVSYQDDELRVIWANRAAAESVGLSVDELVGRHCHEIWQQRSEPCVGCPVLVALQTGKTQEGEMTTPDGRVWSIRGYPVRGKNGHVTGAVEVTLEITHHKQTEAALRQAEEGYRELVENANDIIYSHDLDGNFTSANAAATRIYGYSSEEILQLNIAQIVDPEYLPLARQKIQEKLNGLPQTEPYELLTYSKEGEPIWVEVSTRLIRRDSLPVEVQGIARDITQRKRAEQALQQLMDFNESIVQNVAEGVVVTDVEGDIIFANPTAGALLGYQTEELVGQAWTMIVPLDQQSVVAAADARRAGGESDHYELELLRKDGKRVPILVSGSPRFEAGRFAGTLAVFTDISERKRAEEELRRSYDRLRRALDQTVNALAAAVETRDPYTAGHQTGVANLASAIAREMGLSDDQIDAIRVAGLIHDIGKIQVPSEILSKPSRLTELEMMMVRTHSQAGYDILKTIDFPWPVCQIVLQHHERIDGSGYPQGLSGEDILLGARILAVADVVEAMVSHRPYRPARPLGEALDEIRQNSGTLYDPQVVEACLKVIIEKRFEFEQE